MLEIGCQISLQQLNTLALPGRAEYFCRVADGAELREALAFARSHRLKVTVLGGGSNVVLDGDVPGLVVAMANLGVELVDETPESVTLRVAAGENWHQLVASTVAQRWYGLENLALIPGCVGAAPIQNIGAYGVELADVLHGVEVMDIASGESRTLGVGDCQLGYRDSAFKHKLKGRLVVVAVQITLSKVAKVNLGYAELAQALAAVAEPTPEDVFAAVCQLRRAKLPDPAQIANVGSFFKNPILAADAGRALVARFADIPRYPQADGSVKFPAAWLIDRAGWKGVRVGPVGVHQRQALVLVHFGGGSGGDVLALAADIARDVAEKYGVALELEPVVIGDAAGRR